MAPLWSDLSPGLDCLVRGHIWVTRQEGAKRASWCLWCGSGVSNEHEAGWGAGEPGQGD